MYGRSPLSVVLVCEPGTTGLCVCPPPEHWRRYSVISPSGSSGGPQLSDIDVEDDENLVGGDLGSIKLKLSISDVLVNLN